MSKGKARVLGLSEIILQTNNTFPTIPKIFQKMSMAWDVSSNIWASKEASQTNSSKEMVKNCGNVTQTTYLTSSKDSTNRTFSNCNASSVSDTFSKSILGTNNNQQWICKSHAIIAVQVGNLLCQSKSWKIQSIGNTSDPKTASYCFRNVMFWINLACYINQPRYLIFTRKG